MVNDNDEAQTMIENGYAMMSAGFYRLRKTGSIQDEYDSMGTVIDLLSQDRQHIRNTYEINN